MSEPTTKPPTPDAAEAGPPWKQRRRGDLLWRLLVVFGGAVSTLAGAPGPVSGSLVLSSRLEPCGARQTNWSPSRSTR